MKKRTYLLFFIGILSFIWSITPSVDAADKQTYKVGTDQLNVRSSPSHDGQVIGTLKQGDTVAVFQEKYGWYQTYINGKTAWVASQYLVESNVASTPQAVNQTAQVSSEIEIVGNDVRLRSGPGLEYRIIDTANNGAKYELLETNKGWHKLKSGTNVAWVASWLTDNPTTSPKATNKTTSNHSLKGYNIVLDAGHGGNDPGSIGTNGQKEKDIALKITNTVAEKLRNDGATVILTRTDDSYVSLSNRAQISNDYWAHAFISLHLNAFTSSNTNGISTHYYAGNESNQLAQSIQKALMNHTDLRNRVVQQDSFLVLRETEAVAVLAELGFMTNPSDMSVISTDAYANEVANAISDGLKNYFH